MIYGVEVVKRNVFIEAITVCINYSDHLKYCIRNKLHLDRWIVVTIESDHDTINLCKMHSINYCFSKRINENGAEFAKGKAINEGLSKLEKKGWILFLDCDIVLPPNFREVVGNVPTTSPYLNSIYQVRGRKLIGISKDYRNTHDFKGLRKLQREYSNKFRQLKKTKKMTFQKLEKIKASLQRKAFRTKNAGALKIQWQHFSTGKWNRLIYAFEDIASEHLGYFQLCHSKRITKYPEESSTAALDDLTFARSFKEKERRTLDIDCVHIGIPALGRKLLGNAGYIEQLDKFAVNSLNFESRQELKSYYVAKKDSSKITVQKKNIPLDRGAKSFASAFWGQNISNYGRKATVDQDSFIFFHTFIPSRQAPWFFSIVSNTLIDKRKYRYLCFKIRTSIIKKIEVGYGNASLNKSRWFVLPRNKFLKNEWLSVKIELDQKNPLNYQGNCLVIRGERTMSACQIDVSEVYLKND